MWAQLENADEINNARLKSWSIYRETFDVLKGLSKVELQNIPDGCKHNAHMFYIKCRDIEERTDLINYLKENDIMAVFHYIPLHSAPAGLKFGRFHGEDSYTTKESERLVRLPLYYGIDTDIMYKVIKYVYSFYGQEYICNK